MTASEFDFLALGLVLGIASGVALVEILRARPHRPREVRVTVTPGSIPSWRSTLASSSTADAHGPARGGPGERRLLERIASQRPALAAPTGPTGGRRPSAPAPTGASDDSRPNARVGIRIEPERAPDDSFRAALRAAEARAALVLGTSAADGATSAEPAPATGAAVAVAERPGERREGGAAGPGFGTAAEAGPCADARRLAVERCAVATSARERATAGAARLRELRRRYDEHHERADAAASAGDPLRIRGAKDAAQRAFREARDRARDHAELEDAARTWLAEINRINAESRGARDVAARERGAAAELVPVLERAAVEADAARIAAEAAEEACVAAREAVADCEEATVAAATSPSSASGTASALRSLTRAATGLPAVERADSDEADGIAAAAVRGEPLVLSLVRGDRAALARVANALGNDDPRARRSWMLEIGRLVEAIVERAIEASALDFPTDHPFWSNFTRQQNREIAAALASLGFRFDGLGGWADDRVPTQRDLSLAVGYAGLDPMRIRHWPSEGEAAALFEDVRVSAGEYLAEAAGGLTLGELVSLLGRRADRLTEVWNAWGRIRPLLLEPAAT